VLGRLVGVRDVAAGVVGVVVAGAGGELLGVVFWGVVDGLLVSVTTTVPFIIGWIEQ
jgi:hypothetical protein